MTIFNDGNGSTRSHIVKSVDRSSAKSLAPLAAACVFNARGVISKPSFKLARKTGEDDIKLRISSHEVEPGSWIAEPSWVCRSASMPLDMTPLHRGSQRFKTKSEAVENAMDRAVVMVCRQSHRQSKKADWTAKIEGLRSWMADAMVKVREGDESLPLRGKTVIDIFSGGNGGFSIGLASLGATIELACEIDPNARSVYARNVRPKAMHDDICTLSLKGRKVDIVTMGLLCQAFSPAGKGLGFADPKLAAAYKASMRVLEEVDAKVVIIECSSKFLNLHGGKHSDELIGRMLASGYRAQHRALNSKGFGVPQDRERSVLVFTRVELPVDTAMGFLFPEEAAPTMCVEDIMESDVPVTISESQLTLHSTEPSERVGAPVRLGDIDGKKHQGYRCYSVKGIGIALTASSGGKGRFSGAYRVEGGARALSPREACRLQGQPEWASHHGTHTHAMRHSGNAIATPLARELGRKLTVIFG